MYQTTAKIDGMACSMCEAHVADAIRKGLDVRSVKASKAKRRATILSERPITAEELHAVIDPTGYELGSVTCEPYEKRGFRLFGRG